MARGRSPGGAATFRNQLVNTIHSANTQMNRSSVIASRLSSPTVFTSTVRSDGMQYIICGVTKCGDDHVAIGEEE